MIDLPDWPRAHGLVLAKGYLKQQCDDFVVTERLPEQPAGAGEHLWLVAEKRSQNTEWVARQLARCFGVAPREVGYAGRKDRHAVARQTFSVPLPLCAAAPCPPLSIPGVTLVTSARHRRKLKIGQLIGNHFSIRVRHSTAARTEVEQRWRQVCQQGVPNYFGPQRFGTDGSNLQVGIDWLRGRTKLPRFRQSICLSAVRAFLFNQLLAHRVEKNSWQQPHQYDYVQFTEGKAGFYVEELTADIAQRAHAGKLSACASLVGQRKQRFLALDADESAVLEPYADIVEALIAKQVIRQFRKLRVLPESPALNWMDGDPVFSFFLPAGSFATAVLRELFRLTDQPDDASLDE